MALGGRTVAELQSSMSQIEFAAWVEFYKSNPFDDLHRYYRPAALLVGTHGGDAEKALEWLQPEPLVGDYSDADLRTFRAFGMKPVKKG